MKVKIKDYRNEDRTVNHVRNLDGSDVEDPYAGYSISDHETDWDRTIDSRSVRVDFEELDYEDNGGTVPRLEQGRSKGKNDGQFFVESVSITFSRAYERNAYRPDSDCSTKFGIYGQIVVGGTTRRADGTPGVNHNSTAYPGRRDVDDLDRPYTLESVNADLDTSYASIEELVADAEDKDRPRNKEPRSYALRPAYHRLTATQQPQYYSKTMILALPAWLQAIVDRVHPDRGELAFHHPYEHRFSTFEPQDLARSPREIAEETV